MSDIKQDIEINPPVAPKKRGRPKKIEDMSAYKKEWYEKNKQQYHDRYMSNRDEHKEYSKLQQEKYRKCYFLLKELLANNHIPLSYKERVEQIL